MEKKKIIIKIVLGIILFILFIVPSFENMWFRIIQALLYCVVGNNVIKNIIYLHNMEKKDKN